MELHPQLVALLKRLEQAGYPDQTKVPPAEARRITDDRALNYYGPPEPVERIEDLTLPGPAGTLRARLYAADVPGPLPVVVYFHGGGWVLGSLDSHDKGVRALTNAARCMTVSIDYRLAPEHRFPAAVEDCFAALVWLHQNAAALGGDPTRLALAGDSAGGNLAAVAALMAKHAGGPKLAFQLLIYPITDCRLDSASYLEHAEAPMLNRARMTYFWNQYVPDENQRGDWRASPLRAPDHRGLPPAMIVAAANDPLFSEGEAYARKLREAGVAAEHVVFARMSHAFWQAPPVLDDARHAVDRAGMALRRAFGTAPKMAVRAAE